MASLSATKVLTPDICGAHCVDLALFLWQRSCNVGTNWVRSCSWREKQINMAANINWTDEETEALLNLWAEENVQNELDNYSIRNNVIYGKLSAALSDLGILRTAKQCNSKLKHLREKYRVYKDKIAKSGAGGCKPPKFFDQIDRILGSRPQTRPLHILDSGKSTANILDDDEIESSKSGDDDKSTSSFEGTDILHGILILLHINLLS